MTTRNRFCDNIRGYAILLVVIGHSIQCQIKDFDANPIFEMIYSFHMPLFMFISGYVNCVPGQDKQYNGAWLKRRFQSLVIPFLVWIALPYLFTRNWADFPKYVLHVIQSPDYGYWFLWVLFLNSLFFFFAWNFTQKWGGQTWNITGHCVGADGHRHLYPDQTDLNTNREYCARTRYVILA